LSDRSLAIPLHGRETELAACVSAIDGARAGHGALLLLTGEAGIGKSHLATAAAELARRSGARVA